MRKRRRRKRGKMREDGMAVRGSKGREAREHEEEKE